MNGLEEWHYLIMLDARLRMYSSYGTNFLKICSQPACVHAAKRQEYRYVYMYICIYIYMYIYVYICVGIYICMCIYIYVYAHLYIYVKVYVYVCVKVYACVHVFAHVYVYVYIYVYVYKFTCIYVCVHTSIYHIHTHQGPLEKWESHFVSFFPYLNVQSSQQDERVMSHR